MGERENARRSRWDWLWCAAWAGAIAAHAAGEPAVVGAAPAGALAALGALGSWGPPTLFMLFGALWLDPDCPLSAGEWRSWVKRLALLTAGAAVGFALWDARGAHLGLEWLLEGLIRLVRGEFRGHLWLLPTALGLCLLTPLLQALVRGASRKVLWYGVGLWAVFALCLPFLYRFLPADMGLPWLERVELYGALGCTGYFLLGHLLGTCRTRPGVCLALWLGGLCALGVTWTALSQGQGTPDPRFFDSLSPFAALTAGAVFLAGRRLSGGERPVWGGAARLALWVYLLHPLALDILL